MKILIVVFLFLGAFDVFAQSREVNQHLQMLANGKTDEVRSAIPELLARYPSDPGVMLLHGSVVEDMKLSLDIYRRIVTDYEGSEWADDAQWRIVQHYAINVPSGFKPDGEEFKSPILDFGSLHLSHLHKHLRPIANTDIIHPTRQMRNINAL